MPSVSFTQLSDRLKDLDELNKAHGLFTRGQRGRQWFTVPLNRSAVVLMCAHFEGFLEDLFMECVDFLRNSAVAVDRLPRKLRVAQVETKLSEASEALTRTERFTKLVEAFALAEPLFTPGRQVQPGDLNPKLVVEGFANPSSDRIDWLFDFLEIRAQVEGISWRKASKASVRSNIDKMVETRNDIAHGKVGVMVRKADVTRYRKYVTGFAESLDEILGTKLETVTGRQPW